MINDIKDDARERMAKSLDALSHHFNKIRTGRAHPSLLDGLKVEYYGSDTPLNQVANITVEDSRTLSMNVWDKSMIPAVEKAIYKSDLGLNPVTAGEVIRIPMPMLTEETRRNFIKHAKAEAETARVSIRNVRRDSNEQIKDFLKEKEISEDDARRGEEDIQKITDRHIAEVDKLLGQKEKDLLAI